MRLLSKRYVKCFLVIQGSARDLETKLINGCNLIAGFGNVSERADVRADAICSK